MRLLAISAMLVVAVSAATAADRAGGNTSPAAAHHVENLARGRPYTLTPRPNYPHCTDPVSYTHLTLPTSDLV